MTRAIPWRAVDLVKRFEGYKSEAYLCPAGVWTIGYGHTLAVRPGQLCTDRQASLWLTEDLTRAAKAIERKIGPAVIADLTDNQWGALLSFVFNLGTGNPSKPEWTLWKLLRARNYDAIPAQLTRFCYAGKTKLAGLVRRRAAEVEAWNTGEPGLSDDETHSAVTRLMDTPPAPVERSKAGHVVAACIGCASAVVEGAKAVPGIVGPFANSALVQHMLEVAATLGAGAALAVWALTWLRNHRAKS